MLDSTSGHTFQQPKHRESDSSQVMIAACFADLFLHSHLVWRKPASDESFNGRWEDDAFGLLVVALLAVPSPLLQCPMAGNIPTMYGWLQSKDCQLHELGWHCYVVSLGHGVPADRNFWLGYDDWLVVSTQKVWVSQSNIPVNIGEKKSLKPTI